MLIFPTLDLFCYDLRESLGQGESGREHFKRKLPAETYQHIDKFDIQGEYIELLGENPTFPFEDTIYQGYYYPVRLNDSYALLLDCSCRDNQSSNNFQWVTRLKQQLEQKLAGEQATFGQTWVFYASVLDAQLEGYDTIAQGCYTALFPDANWFEDKTGESEFRGGKWFELWKETEGTKEDEQHVVIILFSNEKTAGELMPELIQDELRLFWYRHKIAWAYSQSRRLEGMLKEKAVIVHQLFGDFYEKTANMEKANKVLMGYFELLNAFEIQAHTIETNLYNYRKRVVKLQQKIPGLQLPNEFEQKTVEKYLPQMQRDQTVFHLQLELVKNLVASVQARETHRNVQHIAAVQTKVEWLEVFFLSFYAAEFTHIMIELYCEKHFSAIGIVVIFALSVAITVFRALDLHKHANKQEFFWIILGLLTLGISSVFLLMRSHKKSE